VCAAQGAHGNLAVTLDALHQENFIVTIDFFRGTFDLLSVSLPASFRRGKRLSPILGLGHPLVKILSPRAADWSFSIGCGSRAGQDRRKDENCFRDDKNFSSKFVMWPI